MYVLFFEFRRTRILLPVFRVPIHGRSHGYFWSDFCHSGHPRGVALSYLFGRKCSAVLDMVTKLLSNKSLGFLIVPGHEPVCYVLEYLSVTAFCRLISARWYVVFDASRQFLMEFRD